MPLTLEQLREYPEFAGLTHIPESSKNETLSVEVADDLQRAIFAPDPITGIPRSDLGLILSKDCRPEVAQYIQNTLMRPRADKVAPDADMALAAVKSRTETVAEYAERLRELCSSNPKSE